MSDLQDKTILLVEDEAILAMEEACVLETYSLVVVTAHSAEQAFRVMAEREIDMVLMDVDLGPGKMDGIEAARRILSGRDVPVVFLSSHTEPDVISRAEDVTSYGYVVKNCGETVLVAAIRMAFRLHRAHVRLRESEELQRITLRSIGDGVVATDTDGRVVAMNGTAERLIGCSLGEAMHRPLLSFFSLVHAVTGKPVADPVEQVLRSGETITLANHTKLVAKNGRELHIADSAAPIHDDDGRVRGVVLVFRDVTESYRKREQLRESEETFRRLFESMAQGVVYHDRTGRIVRANAAAERILGLTHDQLTGKDSYDPRWKAIDEHGDPFPGEYHPATVALRTGTEIERTLMGVFRPEEDDYVWISVSAVPEFRPGESQPFRVFATFEDVTAQRRIAELQESNRRFLETVIDSIQDFISIQDPSLRIQGANQRVREMYRVHEPLVGKLCYQVYHNRSEPCTNCPTLRALERKSVQREVIAVSDSGESERWFELSSHPVVAPDGSVRAVVEHGRDVTDMVREKQATQRLLANKATLLREVHHRMKNNMSIVASLLALKSQQVEDPECREALQDARTRLGSVQALYERLHRADEYAFVEMRGYLGDLIRELSTAYGEHDIGIRPTIEHMELSADTAVCVGIIVNELVTNAVKHAYPDQYGGTVHVRLRPAEDDHVELLVADGGVGLPKDAVEGRLPGFGLAMVKGLIRQLSGSFDAETAPGGGSRFLMRFPRRL